MHKDDDKAKFGVYIQRDLDENFELHWTCSDISDAYSLAEMLEEAGHFAVCVRTLPLSAGA